MLFFFLCFLKLYLGYGIPFTDSLIEPRAEVDTNERLVRENGGDDNDGEGDV